MWPQWSVSDASTAKVRQTQYEWAEGDTTFSAGFTGPANIDIGGGHCFRSTGYSNPGGSVDVLPVIGLGSVSFTSPNPPVIRRGESATLIVPLQASPSLPANTSVDLTVSIVDQTSAVNFTITREDPQRRSH